MHRPKRIELQLILIFGLDVNYLSRMILGSAKYISMTEKTSCVKKPVLVKALGLGLIWAHYAHCSRAHHHLCFTYWLMSKPSRTLIQENSWYNQNYNAKRMKCCGISTFYYLMKIKCCHLYKPENTAICINRKIFSCDLRRYDNFSFIYTLQHGLTRIQSSSGGKLFPHISPVRATNQNIRQ